MQERFPVDLTYVGCLTGFFVLFFIAVFKISDIVMSRTMSSYRDEPSSSVRADSAGRVGSTVHCGLIWMFAAYVLSTTTWGDFSSDKYLQPIGDSIDAGVFHLNWFIIPVFCFLLGYFIVDSAIVVVYKAPLWGFFFAHHVLTATSFFVYFLVMTDEARARSLFLILAFMLVEIVNPFINNCVLLERAGMKHTALYGSQLFLQTALWIPTRLGICTYNLYLTLRENGQLDRAAPEDKLPLSICIWSTLPLVGLCYYVFIVMLAPECYRRWLRPKQPQIQGQKNNGNVSSPTKCPVVG